MPRDLRGIPTTANRFDKQDACCHLLRSKIYQRLPIDQVSGLSRDHVEVAVYPHSVSGSTGREKSAGGLPIKRAIACSSWARRIPRFVACASAV